MQFNANCVTMWLNQRTAIIMLSANAVPVHLIVDTIICIKALNKKIAIPKM